MAKKSVNIKMSDETRAQLVAIGKQRGLWDKLHPGSISIGAVIEALAADRCCLKCHGASRIHDGHGDWYDCDRCGGSGVRGE